MQGRSNDAPRAPGAAPAGEEPGALVARAIDAFQAGEDREESFRFLFESYHRPLRRFFARKGFPPDVCLDLTQETFLRIYQGLGTYRREARFETWLYRVATTTYLKRLRARATEKRSGKEVSTEALETTRDVLKVRDRQLDDVLSDEAQAALRVAVDELPPQMRRCLKLRVYHELSYREIAAVLRVSIQTVKAHLFQARGKLKQRLER